MAAAACRHFSNVYAIEINRYTLDQMVPTLGKDNLCVASDLSEVPGRVSAMMMWHTLEHLPEAWKLGCEISNKLQPGGVFYWQVPMYRDPYVCNSHYTFFNEYSVQVYSERIGLSLEGVWHDETNQFLTCLARRST